MGRNEAIESLRQLYSDASDADKAALECLIPELKESEGERIRKQIEQILIEHDWSATYRISKDDCLAWLEKQKEQKAAEWNDEDEQAAKEIRAMFNRGTFLCPDIQFLSNWLVSVKDRITRPHWKPSEEQMEALLDAQIPGKKYDCDVLLSLYNDLKAL